MSASPAVEAAHYLGQVRAGRQTEARAVDYMARYYFRGVAADLAEYERLVAAGMDEVANQ